MKRFYSEFKYDPAFRKTGGVISEAMNDEILAIVSEHDTGVQAASWLAQSIMLSGHGIDYFLVSPGLSGFISKMVREFTADVLDVFADLKHTAFVIHPPSPEPAILVGINKIVRGQRAFTTAVMQAGSQLRGLGTHSFESRERRKALFPFERLVIGFALYAAHFPKAIKDGLPDCAKFPAHYKKARCAGVQIAEELIDRPHGSQHPHMRACYWKFLSHERFTKARGTTILVREYFVKGKCKIVLSPDE